MCCRVHKLWRKSVHKAYLEPDIQSNIIHNCGKVETTQMSINWWKDTQNVVCPYNGILFSHKKEWNADIHCDTDDFWKHGRWENPVTKVHVLQDFISMNFPERPNLQTQKVG